jgi:ABC-type sugar transport system ATPase subunit
VEQLVLHTKHLSKTYGSTKAISNVNFSLEKGEIHAIVGSNGAGKSTLVKLLFGEVQATSGQIFVRGLEQKKYSPETALEKGIAMVPQDFGLVNSMTVVENLFISNTKNKRSILYNPRNVKSTYSKLLQDLSLKVDLDRLVSDLQISEKQILAIAKVFTFDSDIIIFDEPTSVLSTDAFRIIKDLIKKLKASGKSIIYITHKIDEVFEIADTVSVLHEGELKLTSRPSKSQL